MEWNDEYRVELGIPPAILSKADEDRDKRPVVFNKQAYRDRNIVKRLIGWLKACRRVFSRFEKKAKNFLSRVHIASIQRHLRKAAG